MEIGESLQVKYYKYVYRDIFGREFDYRFLDPKGIPSNMKDDIEEIDIEIPHEIHTKNNFDLRKYINSI